jgi:pyruvate,water dikinase
VDVDDPDGLAQAAAAVRALVEAYRGLAGDDRDTPVAVRSSATAEDTEAASFAGMNETFLNMPPRARSRGPRVREIADPGAGSLAR